MQLNFRYVVNTICTFRRKINIDFKHSTLFFCSMHDFRRHNQRTESTENRSVFMHDCTYMYLYKSDLKVNYENYMECM